MIEVNAHPRRLQGKWVMQFGFEDFVIDASGQRARCDHGRLLALPCYACDRFQNDPISFGVAVQTFLERLGDFFR